MPAKNSGKTLNTAIANPIRTGVQIIPSAAITEFVSAFWLQEMSERQYTAMVVFLTLVVSFLQNSFENLKGVGFLRRVPPTNVPVVDENDGHRDQA